MVGDCALAKGFLFATVPQVSSGSPLSRHGGKGSAAPRPDNGVRPAARLEPGHLLGTILGLL